MDNWFADDPALAAHLRARLPPDAWGDAEKRLRALGDAAPREIDPAARLADRHRPVLHRFSPTGERIDEVEFHPSYRDLQRLARDHRVFTASWEGMPRALHYALGYVYGQAECGYYCPACMTDGAALVLARHAPRDLADRYVARLVQPSVEGALEGAMYLTEKGGGSDLAQTATRATKGPDGSWRLTGEKWFCSNCVAEVALVLARMTDAPGTGGLGLFLLPRTWEGRRNPGLRLERLKDKLGVTSMPTGEIVLDGALAHLVAPAPDGLKAMLDMVNVSRLYNAVASVAVARRAVREGVRWGLERRAFGKRLIDQPLYARSLLDVAVETEGALAFVLEAASLMDGGPDAARRLRAMTPMAKAATGKLAVRAASEACEWLGGNGYVEDFVTPRLLRDAQVLPIWEGATNVQALDFLRAAREGAVGATLVDATRRLDAARGRVPAPVADGLARGLADADATLDGPPEAGAHRALLAVYHAVAGVLLAEAAAREGGRFQTVAEVYAARHVAPRGPEGERVLEANVGAAARVLA